MKNTLKVGDVLYSKYMGRIHGKTVIERVTKTQAIAANGMKFKINYNDWINVIGVTYSSSYYIETPQLKAEYEKQEFIKQVKNANLEKLTNEQLANIVDILNQTSNEKNT